jgi:predicted phosphoadenosine phosphosulfate sulfurtransferase
MPKHYRIENVFDAALDRMIKLYEDGHRVVVSFSGGKDSGICVELAILAATLTNKLPVEVVMRDEEIMYPGTFEYAERIAKRQEVKFYWYYANQPIVNIFNRQNPYFWVFDPKLSPEKWVRQPPDFAVKIPEQSIQGLIGQNKFPAPEGKKLIAVIGLRTDESMLRKMGLMSSKGYVTKGKSSYGTYNARPIYDWSDGDVWKAIRDNNWDYNKAYDVMHRLGISRNKLRIAPPTLAAAAIDGMSMAAKAWPQWFDKVCQRLPGVRTASMFGRRSVEPIRKLGESWKDCFHRTCIDEAPDWIAERSRKLATYVLMNHKRHSTESFPEVTKCPKCQMTSSWKNLAKIMYMGEPFSMKVKVDVLPYVEPEYFREGAGTWGGKPTW